MVSKKHLRRHVAEFYEGRSLSGPKAQWLVGLAERAPHREESQMSSLVKTKTWRPTVIVALAAGVALLVAATALTVRTQGVVSGSVVHQPDPDRMDIAAVTATGLSTPRLVAVKIRADWCARSPKVAPIFDDLTSEYGNEPILFVTLDITDEIGRQQARYLAGSLGISSVYDEPFESGMVKLIDREDGQVLAILTGEQQLPTMEGALMLAFASGP